MFYFFILLIFTYFSLSPAQGEIKAIEIGIVGCTTGEMKSAGMVQLWTMDSAGCHFPKSDNAPNCCCDKSEYQMDTAEIMDIGLERHPCFTNERPYCCKVKHGDRSWTGVWQSANNGKKYFCNYYPSKGGENDIFVLLRCGIFQCSSLERDEEPMEIGGSRCNLVYLHGLDGEASAGFIRWMKNGKVKNYWFKQ